MLQVINGDGVPQLDGNRHGTETIDSRRSKLQRGSDGDDDDGDDDDCDDDGGVGPARQHSIIDLQ